MWPAVVGRRPEERSYGGISSLSDWDGLFLRPARACLGRVGYAGWNKPCCVGFPSLGPFWHSSKQNPYLGLIKAIKAFRNAGTHKKSIKNVEKQEWGVFLWLSLVTQTHKHTHTRHTERTRERVYQQHFSQINHTWQNGHYINPGREFVNCPTGQWIGLSQTCSIADPLCCATGAQNWGQCCVILMDQLFEGHHICIKRTEKTIDLMGKRTDSSATF